MFWRKISACKKRWKVAGENIFFRKDFFLQYSWKSWQQIGDAIAQFWRPLKRHVILKVLVMRNATIGRTAADSDYGCLVFPGLLWPNCINKVVEKFKVSCCYGGQAFSRWHLYCNGSWVQIVLLRGAFWARSQSGCVTSGRKSLMFQPWQCLRGVSCLAETGGWKDLCGEFHAYKDVWLFNVQIKIFESLVVGNAEGQDHCFVTIFWWNGLHSAI